MLVGLLTIAQKNLITGQNFAPDCLFNPIQDAADNWVISIEEIQGCTNPDFEFVKDLPLIEYVPKNIAE